MKVCLLALSRTLLSVESAPAERFESWNERRDYAQELSRNNSLTYVDTMLLHRT